MKKMVFKFVILIVATCLCSFLIYHHVERAEEVEIKEDILVNQVNLESSFLTDIDNYTLESPKIVVNPYGISPLTALIIFNTKDLTTPSITIKGKDENSTFTNTFKPAKQHILPVYGLYADSENEVVITVNEHDYLFKIKTDKLPDDFVKALVTKSSNDLSNDLYFVTPSSRGYTSAYDVNGDVRWYLTENFIWDIKRLNNGHLLLSSNRLINNPYYMTGLVEIDLLGKIYYEYNMPGGYHHDAVELPSSNLLVASDDFSSNTVEDYIVEIDRSTGDIVKTFDLKEIIQMSSTGNENWTEYDWFHNNSVWYDSKTNSITLSGRHQDAVINIDYSTGELNWIIGDNTNWDSEYQKYFFKPINDLEWQWSQHAAMVLPNGNVFIFDNGNNRSKIESEFVKAEDNYSRGVIYKINSNNKTIEQVWQYGKERGSSYYSPYISDVDYLGLNHYLIHSGGHVETDNGISNNPAGFEDNTDLTSYTTEIKNDEVIFEMVLPSNYYRAEKLSLYANDVYMTGTGVRLGNMGETKTTDNNPMVLINHDSSDIVKKYDIEVYQEVDRLVVKGSFEKKDEVEVILDNLFKNKTYEMVISSKPYTALCVDLNNQNKGEKINAYKYINKLGLSGKYYLYIKINGKIYDLDQYIEV